MTTVSFNPDLLKAVHEHGPDIAMAELANHAGLNVTNISRGIKRHRAAGLIKASALQLTDEGARLAGVAQPPAVSAVMENTPPSTDTERATPVPLSSLFPSDLNPRKVFDEGEIDGLASSILHFGLMQNLTVRPNLDGKFEIVAGERRYRAMKLLAAQGEISPDYPVDVKIRDLSDLEVLEHAVIENGQRKDIHPLEEAEAIAKLQAAKLEDGTKSDARAVCREIGELLGFTERWAQIRVNMVKRLSESTREAFRSGVFTSVKWADELGRWPHDLQGEAIDAIESGEITTEADLKDWLRGESLPAGKQCFSGEDYTDRGGQLSEPDEEDQVYFVNPGIARKLAEEFREETIQKLHDKHGFNGTPRKEHWSNNHGYPNAKDLDPKPPKELCTVEAVLDRQTLELSIRQPVIAREAYDAWVARTEGEKKLKENQAAAGETGKEPAEPPTPKDDEPEPAKPLGRGHWLAGATARTHALRETIADNAEIAIALTVISLLPKANYPTSMTRLSTEHASGDARTIGVGTSAMEFIREAHPEWLNEHDQIINPHQVMTHLIADPGSAQVIFVRLISDLTIDCDYTALPGTMPEALAMAEAELVKPVGGEVVDQEWMKRYSRSQQSVLIDAYKIFLDTDEIADLKKVEASEKIAEAFNEEVTPIEARFVSKNVALALEARLIKGQQV